MATIKQLTNCLDTTVTTTKDRLPNSIIKAVNAGRKDLTLAAVDQHLADLATQRKQITDQYNLQRENLVESSSAKSFTNRSDDESNELNTFKPLTATRIWRNLVHQLGSIFSAAKNRKNTAAENNVIRHFNETFLPTMTDAIKSIYKVKEGSSLDYRHEDPIQYFARHTENGEAISTDLDPVITEAIAATAYEWLGNESTQVAYIQREDAIQRILGLGKEDTPPGIAYHYLSQIGTSREALAENLGRTILERLAIRDTADSAYHAKARMEMSLGFMAIAALEQSGFVKRNELFIDAKEALVSGMNPEHGALYISDEVRSRENNPTQKFIAVAQDQLGVIPEITEIESLMDVAPETFTNLFANTTESSVTSFGKHTLKEAMKLGKSIGKAAGKLVENLQKYTDMEWVSSDHSMSAFTDMLALADADEEAKGYLDTILGKVNKEGKLKLREDSIKGQHDGIDADVAYVRKWLEASKKAGKKSFYIPNGFMSNFRMLQKGKINPQNSKLHRNLFAPKAWQVSFDPEVETETFQAFREAVALAFDIESGKEGGVENQLAELDKKLENGTVQLAIRALQEYDQTGQLTKEGMRAVAEAVELLDNKLHGFKGMLEWARYLNHESGKFTTDIYKEIDGVSNGPVISTLMFISDNDDQQGTMATLAMGGVSVNPNEVNLDEEIHRPNLNDAYQRMGQEWAIQLAEMKKQFDLDNDTTRLEWARAIGRILGPFQHGETDESKGTKKGVINKVIRKLSKPRTMQTTYGASQRRQTQILAYSDVIHDGIYGGVENIMNDIINNPDGLNDGEITAKFDQLLADVATLTDTNPITSDVYKTDGQWNLDKIALFDLKAPSQRAIEVAVQETYGLAMGRAIDKVYNQLIEARTPFLRSIELTVALYNKALETRVNNLYEIKMQNALQQQGYDDTPSYRDFITKKHGQLLQIDNREMSEIVAELEPLLPKIPTPTPPGGTPSYLPLVVLAKDKDYLDTYSAVEQNYTSETLTKQKGYAQGIPYLAPPGAAPLVKSVQMIDAMIANHLMGTDANILNNHDGFSHGIKDSDTVRIEANKRFYEIAKDYSLGEEIATATRASINAAAKELGGVSAETLLDAFQRDGVVDSKTVDKLLKKDSPADVARNIMKKIVDNAVNMGEQVTRNKKTVVDAITEMAQYPDKGKGYSIENPGTASHIFGDVPVDKILDIDAANTDRAIETLAKLVTEGYGSSANEVSTDPADYAAPNPMAVDSQNVSQIFNTLLAQDQAAKFGSIPVSDSHKNHLTRILDNIVAKVMDPVQLYIGRNKLDEETKGQYTVGEDGQTIWMQTQKVSNHPLPGMLGHGLRMSAAEVYTHELTHHITYAGLKASAHLKKQAYDLYDMAYKAFKQRYGNEAYRVFMDPSLDPTDSANAYEVQAAKARWDYVFNPKKEEDNSNHGVHEFLTFGLTNENFKRELSYITTDNVKAKKAVLGIFEKNLQQTVVNLFNKIMDFIHTAFFNQQHSKRMDQEVENLVTALAHVDGRTKSAVYQTFVSMSNTTAAISGKFDDRLKDVVSKVADKNKYTRVIKNVEKLINADHLLAYKTRVILNWYNEKEEGLIPAIATEMAGTTERLKPLHTLLNRRNRAIDAAKAEAASTVYDSVNSWFKTELNPEEKSAITKVLLKADISSILDNVSQQSLQRIIVDDKSREDRINYLLQQISNDSALKAFKDYFENASDDLGYFMITSRTRKDGVPMWNARNITLMKDSPYSKTLDENQRKKAERIVDELASLMALRYVRQDHRISIGHLINTEWGALDSVMRHHAQLKENALEDSFGGKPGLMQKGYTKQILNARIQFKQGTIADKEALERAGYIMQKTPLPRDPNDPVKDDIYLFKSTLGTINDYQAGIVSLTQNTAKGQNSYRIQQQIGNTRNAATQARSNEQQVRAAVDQKIKRMFKPRKQQSVANPSENYMIPKFDVNGNITEMRYMMSEDVKDNVLQQFSEFDAVMASMTSQIIDKKYTPEINNELILALKELHESEYSDKKESFVEISPYSPVQRYRDIYHMLPPGTQEQIKSVWGSSRMFVPQDVVTLAFGQRKQSIVDLFAKSRSEMKMLERSLFEVLTFALGWSNPFKKEEAAVAEGRAVTRAKRVEEFMIQLTKLAKSNIVIRNLGVTHGNYMSNMAYVLSKGVPAHEVLKRSREAINSALRYQVDKAKLNKLEAQKIVVNRKTTINQATKDAMLSQIDRKITRLQDQLANNPSTPMIEAGLMPQIVDDVDTGHIQSPYQFGLEAAINKTASKLPKPLEAATRTLFMTEDTEGYKMLNNAVKMTDYVGRYILYQHYTQTKGVKHSDAVSMVTDEFVNFDLPTHKILEYGNNVGVLWFSKYQLRILKHIKNVVKEKPFTALSVFLLGSFIGNNNILNSIPGVTKDLFQGVGDPFTTFMGTPDEILYVDLVDKMASNVVDY